MKTQTQRTVNHVKTGRDWSYSCHRSESTRGYQKLQAARKFLPLDVWEGAWSYQHFDFGLLTSRTKKE